MNSVNAARLMALRHYFEPIPELMVLAGEESAGPIGPGHRPTEEIVLASIAAAQLSFIPAVMTWFWLETWGRASDHTERTLLQTAARVERASVTSTVYRALHTCIDGKVPFAQIPLQRWACYLSSAALARLQLLIGAGHLHRGSGTLNFDEMDRLARRHLHTVTGCFWHVGEEDPVVGLAGWVAERVQDPGMLLSAMVLESSDVMNERRWNALHDFTHYPPPPWQRWQRFRSPFQVETVQ